MKVGETVGGKEAKQQNLYWISISRASRQRSETVGEELLYI